MQQGNVDLDKISSIHKLQLRDMFHAFTRKEITKTHQKRKELMEEVVKALQEILESNVDTTLSSMENFELLIDSFKTYAFGLNEEEEKEVEKRINDKRMLEITKKCAIAHKKFLELLKDAEGCVEEAKTLYNMALSGSEPHKV